MAPILFFLPALLFLVLWFTVDVLPMDKSPVKYYLEEVHAGYSLRSTTTLGNDKERERVYDTIFRLPWRCELVKVMLFSSWSAVLVQLIL